MVIIKYAKICLFYMAIVDASSMPNWRSLVSYNGGKNASEPLRNNLPYNNSGKNASGPAAPPAQMGMSIVRKTITISSLTFMQLCAVNPPKCINLINSIFGNFFINTTTNLDTTISNFVEFYSNGNKDPTTWDDVIGMDLACQDINQNLDMNNALKIMRKSNMGIIIVRDQKKNTVGIISDGDIKRINNKNTNFKKIVAKKIMKKNPISVDKNILASKCLAIMTDKKITCLCIHSEKNKNKTIGILHIHSILNSNIQ